MGGVSADWSAAAVAILHYIDANNGHLGGGTVGGDGISTIEMMRGLCVHVESPTGLHT